MGRYFGTDGVRGIANKDLTPELAFRIGKAGASVLGGKGKTPLIIIGKDTRISGDMLEDALSAGILAAGGNVVKVGVVPTPAVAFLTQKYGADAGAVISASHNSYEYNGIKFFNSTGFKLDDEIEAKIEDILDKSGDIGKVRVNGELGTVLKYEDDFTGLYADFLLSTIDISLDGFKVVLDCANGASYKVAPYVFRQLGAEVIVISDEPTGVNINLNCGSTKPEALCNKVKECGAQIGFAYDGDADRLITVDDLGRVIDGDKEICICARMMKEAGTLSGDTVTATVMSNIGLHKYVEAMGCSVIDSQVGDRYVIAEMLKSDCMIGGEQSGHIIFRNYATTGDGTMASLQFMKALSHLGKKASELADEVVLYPQVLKNVKVKNENKNKFKTDEEVQAGIKKIEAAMSEDGRVLIRSSGTEPIVRVMIEGKDLEKINAFAEEMAELLGRKFA